MENQDKCKIRCECGQVHELETDDIYVGSGVEEAFLLAVINSESEKLIILSDKEYVFLGELVEKLKACNKQYKIILKNDCCATIKVAEELADYSQDLVIAIGGEEIISVGKYYAYSCSCPIFVFAVNNFIDLTFSKFSRLYDGITFNTYLATSPKKIFAKTTDRDFFALQQYYIASKFIAIFDNIISEEIYSKQICCRLKDFFKKTMAEYMLKKEENSEKQKDKNIWLLIRLGQGMSFYNQTLNFFGGDYALVNLLQAQKFKSNFLELETISLKLIINAYSSFFHNGVVNGEVNLSKHIQKLSELLKITPTESIKRLTNSELVCFDNEKRLLVTNRFPYLRAVLRKTLRKVFMLHTTICIKSNFLKKYHIEQKTLEKSFALCSDINYRATTLNVIEALGYFEKLLIE